jgi:thiamine biosynthesis protein ThiS
VRITVNDNPIELDGQELSIKELLAAMHYSFPLINVRLNGTLISKQDFAATLVHEGDDVNVYHLIGGG